MSGDVPSVVLAEGHDDLVHAAGLVVAHAGVLVAVIGGLAVTVRLATVHRATADVDLVSDETVEAINSGHLDVVTNLLEAGVAVVDPTAPGDQVRLDVGGTKVEIIGTAEVHDTSPDLARLMVLGHRWALDTAAPVTIMVAGSDVTVTAPVAQVPALLAMKLHAIQGRSSMGAKKKASDAWDIFRLLGIVGDAGAAFAGAPDDLAALVADSLSTVFVLGGTRTRRSLREWGDPAWVGAMTEPAMVGAASPVIAALS